MLTVQTSAGLIAYDERGEGDPIVLLPSRAHDHHDYDELRALLPKRFRTISLDWPAHGSSPPGRGPVRADVEPAFSPRDLPVVLRLLHAHGAEADRRSRDAGIDTARGDPGLGVVSELWRGFAAREHDLRAEAATIGAPTLLWGRRDPVISVKVGRRLAQTIPGASLVEFDTGHVPHTSDPAGVAAALVPFADAAFANTGAVCASPRAE
jgi:pimeloyl-ACP methyl ester carboxylesterase